MKCTYYTYLSEDCSICVDMVLKCFPYLIIFLTLKSMKQKLLGMMPFELVFIIFFYNLAFGKLM